MADRTRRIKESDLLEVIQLAGARYEDLSRKHAQALEEAYATEGRDGNMLLKRCQQMQSKTQGALDEYVVALERFSELVLNRKLPVKLSINSEPQQSLGGTHAENQRLLERYKDATAVLAAASKQVVDASGHGIPGAVDRLWPQCEWAWLACVALRDEIAAKRHKTRGR